MGELTTHVLDTSTGRPGAGIRVELFRLGHTREMLSTTETNADGRCDSPLACHDAFQVGEYELVFFAGAYYRSSGLELPDPAFLEQVVIRFGVADEKQNYHVPLLLSPYGYSTYRGS